MDFKHYRQLKNNIFKKNEKGELLPRYQEEEPRLINPLVLAYVGDAYYHLYIRERLLNFELSHVRLLNDISMMFVSATWQAKAYEVVKDHLTEEEQAIFKRGKNAKSHAPRVASIKDYHTSTGIEAVFGFLYLSKRIDRLKELCEISFMAMTEVYNQGLTE